MTKFFEQEKLDGLELAVFQSKWNGMFFGLKGSYHETDSDYIRVSEYKTLSFTRRSEEELIRSALAQLDKAQSEVMDKLAKELKAINEKRQELLAITQQKEVKDEPGIECENIPLEAESSGGDDNSRRVQGGDRVPAGGEDNGSEGEEDFLVEDFDK